MEWLEKHDEYCRNNEAVKVVMPEKGSYVYKKVRHPFVIYADFESLIESMDECQPDPKKSCSNKIQKHRPMSFCYYIKCFDDTVFKPKLVCYTAKSDEEDVSKVFADAVSDEVKDIYHRFKKEVPVIYREKEKRIFEKSKLCWLCEREFSPADLEKCGLGGKVRDHCHCTGRFRGAAHNKCNLDCRITTFIPVVFHNLSGYDAHLFVKNLGVEEGNINCIPKNEEKYISFTKEVIVDTFKKEPESKEIKVKRGLRFIDSFKFMGTGLDKLVSNLQKYENTQQYFADTDTDLLLQKGVFPYEYVGEYKRLEETSLPPQSTFYSKLDDEGITDDSYKHAQRVFSEFGCRSI